MLILVTPLFADDVLDRKYLAAARMGTLKEVINCLEEGAKLNVTDDTKYNALHLSVMKKRKDIAEYLLKQGIRKNDKEAQNGYTPIFFAVGNGDFEMIKLLVEHKVNLKVKSNIGSTLLHLAAGNADADILEYLIGKKLDTNALNNQKNTPMHLAAFTGKTKIVNILVKHKVNLERKNKDKMTPFLLAVKEGHLETTKALVKAGSKVNVTGKNKYGCLHYAIKLEDSMDMLEYLLTKKVKVETKTKKGFTPLLAAVCLNKTKEVLLLFKKGADIKAKSKIKETGLHYASLNANLYLVKLFIGEGLSLDFKDQKGQTALHYACRNEDGLETVKLLVKQGANVNAKLNKTKDLAISEATPRDVARAFESDDIDYFLKEKGGKYEIFKNIYK